MMQFNGPLLAQPGNVCSSCLLFIFTYSHSNTIMFHICIIYYEFFFFASSVVIDGSQSGGANLNLRYTSDLLDYPSPSSSRSSLGSSSSLFSCTSPRSSPELNIINRGQGVDQTILVLASNSAGFGDAAHPKSFIQTRDGNQAFNEVC